MLDFRVGIEVAGSVAEYVCPIVPSPHGDAVTEVGEEMDVIASADHAAVFGTRHRTAPLWTVQFHPEITAAHRDQLVKDFDWESPTRSFSDISAVQLFEDFEAFAGEAVPSDTVRDPTE